MILGKQSSFDHAWILIFEALSFNYDIILNSQKECSQILSVLLIVDSYF